MRMQSDLPKQFIEINQKPIIFHTIEKFLAFDASTSFIISLHKDYIALWDELIKQHHFNFDHKIVIGGKERFHSVQNALAIIPNDSVIGIHDAVRPFVSQGTIKNCFELVQKQGVAIPVTNVINSIRIINNNTTKLLERDKLKAVQTPQYFDGKKIKESYNQLYKSIFTDDASVYEAFGNTICLTKGNIENIKITSPLDLALAKLISQNK